MVLSIIIKNNSSAADLFASIFHSFKAGIANAIYSFKWQKIFIKK